MYTLKEKILLLGSLFHDIGKFEQRCTSRKVKHEQLGTEFVNELKDLFIVILNNDANAFEQFSNIINEHHNSSTKEPLTQIARMSDHLSASEREDEEPGNNWRHHFLTSLFTKISLLNNENVPFRYYRHDLLTNENFRALIPEFESTQDALESRVHYKNQGNIFDSFKSDIKSVLQFYQNDDDFNSIINLLLIVFEKYMWCIPDFTGSAETDISLFNHSKDVAGISHALYKSKNNSLNLIIGDIPGIQDYIFNVTYKKPAKILRGRSIFVQILIRTFASIFLRNFGLTDTNLIMIAGGKFYILAPQNDQFEETYKKSVFDIEQLLIENYNYELKYAAGYHTFSYEELKKKKISFGEIIDKASYSLLNGRRQIFKSNLLDAKFSEKNFLPDCRYIDTSEKDSNKIKCAVTDQPVRKGREKYIEGEIVDKQVWNEYKIGEEIVYESVVIQLDRALSKVQIVKSLSKYIPIEESIKIIINPELDQLLKYEGNKRSLLKNALFLEVASYASLIDDQSHVLEFKDMADKNVGAKFLTLIKGDIDNLGLIMSNGLTDDQHDLTSISRTTTLSNHLKYYFSFFINGFLKEFDQSNKKSGEQKPELADQYVYTIFAGGDDLMLVTTQSASLKLLKAFNDEFNDFVCHNPEVHVSYSLTNFKDHTPIRIVSSLSKDGQDRIKSFFKNRSQFPTINEFLDSSNPFSTEKEKSGLYLFETAIHNSWTEELINYKNQLVAWVENDSNPVSKGIIRNLFLIAEMIKKFDEESVTTKLMWHPILSYMINRNLKGKNGKYKNEEVGKFFDVALSLNKEKSHHLRQLLYPLLCSVIYETRNSKGE